MEHIRPKDVPRLQLVCQGREDPSIDPNRKLYENIHEYLHDLEFIMEANGDAMEREWGRVVRISLNTYFAETIKMKCLQQSQLPWSQARDLLIQLAFDASLQQDTSFGLKFTRALLPSNERLNSHFMQAFIKTVPTHSCRPQRYAAEATDKSHFPKRTNVLTDRKASQGNCPNHPGRIVFHNENECYSNKARSSHNGRPPFKGNTRPIQPRRQQPQQFRARAMHKTKTGYGKSRASRPSGGKRVDQ
ncbi:hypothetical protein DM01DRAFT_1371287 [Hesseltinella vesiculosa]|uniref:Uncharacterized protein n=1 Tax=Hesseltinella vesiculosa TaxID=101127 RepID=A0A1X2GQW6_9FUNG|nr:hypothetical protein DM01DRAFT_1371287 [Hesseltinella vesiculosa]